MGVGQHAQHAQGFVVFDEAHAAHVGSQLEDYIDALRGPKAMAAVLQVQCQILHSLRRLIPLMYRFHVDCAHDVDAIGQ